MPQFWPAVLSASGGAPTVTFGTNSSGHSHASAPSGATPTGRSWTTPPPKCSCWRASGRYHPQVEVDPLGRALRERRHAGRRPAVHVGGPGAGRRPVHLTRRAPRGEAPQLGRLPVAPGRELGLAGAVGADATQRLALDQPHPVAVDAVAAVELGAGKGEVGQVGRRGAGDVGDAQVQRAAEVAGHRRVGAVFLGVDRGGGVERVDDDEGGAVTPCGVAHRCQVAQVPDAPAGARPRGVELRRDPPGALLVGWWHRCGATMSVRCARPSTSRW